MIFTTILEALAVLMFIAGLLNEKKIIQWENRMIRKVRRWKDEKVSTGRIEGGR